jgi:ribosomal protein S18 acetylase RimI-like enzyme
MPRVAVAELEPLTWEVGLMAELGPEELWAIADLTAAAWRAAYPFLPADYLASLDAEWWLNGRREINARPGMAYVNVCSHGRLAGVAVFGPSHEDAYPDDAHLWSLYLRPDLVGSGLGHLLFERAEAEIAQRGYPGVLIDAWADNHHAVEFYESYGYDVIVDDVTWPAGGIDFPCVMLRKAATPCCDAAKPQPCSSC